MIQTSKSEADRTVTSFKNKFIRLFSTITNTKFTIRNHQERIVFMATDRIFQMFYSKTTKRQPHGGAKQKIIIRWSPKSEEFTLFSTVNVWANLLSPYIWKVTEIFQSVPRCERHRPSEPKSKKGKENTKRCIKAAIFNVIQLTKNQKNIHWTPQKALISV